MFARFFRPRRAWSDAMGRRNSFEVDSRLFRVGVGRSLDLSFCVAPGERVQLGGCFAIGGLNRAAQLRNKCLAKQPGNNLQIGKRGRWKGARNNLEAQGAGAWA